MMNENEPSKDISLELQVLGFILNKDFYGKVKNIVSRDMFEGRYATLFDTITYGHKTYDIDIHPNQLSALVNDRNPAMPKSAVFELYDIIGNLPTHISPDMSLELDVVKNFWVRDRARQIGEKAIAIFTGESEHFGELKTLIDMVEDGRMSDKTTFCAFIAASYVKQKQKVVYWANEEPAEKIKLRIIQSYFGMTYEEMNSGAEALLPRCIEEIEPYLTVMDSVGTSMDELNDYAQLNEPDVMFCDQLDKFRVSGEFNRGDERLKETYVLAREIAKRNRLLVWSVSQASFEAHDRQFIDYAMLDGSRTGKAGEADVIIGIGKTGTSEEENTTRHICISKNKLNGWHGMFNSHIDIQRGVYY